MDSPAASRARPDVTSATRLRPWLGLGRVSNLPTVWSNTLAACWLGGWSEPLTLVTLCAAAMLLYVGGMYLNDVCDVEFDARFRPERPIVAGAVTQRSVATAAVAMLACAIVLLVSISWQTALWGAALAVAILLYDVTHKRSSAAPFNMGACRMLLYLTAASAGILGITPRVFIFSLALALYVAGLSYVARAESGAHSINRIWPWLLVSAPLLCAFALQSSASTCIRALPLLICLGIAALLIRRNRVGAAVGIFLAAIVFVDLLAVGTTSVTMHLVFVALFCATLLSQRYVPAT